MHYPQSTTADDTTAPGPSMRQLHSADGATIQSAPAATAFDATQSQLDAYAVSGSSPPLKELTQPVPAPIGTRSVRKQWLTLADIAEELDVSVRTVMRWVERGELPAIELPGGRKRVHRQMFDAWLESRLTTPAPTAERG